MKYYVIENEGELVVIGKSKPPVSYIKIWPSDVPLKAAKYLKEDLDIDAAHALWLGAEVAKVDVNEKAVRIKDEYDKCDYLVGIEAVKCFNTTNVDAMNADKDTITEILKGNGYLVNAGFKARRDIPSENIIKGTVLNSKEDLERYAAAQWQNILDYGQKRVELMAARDNDVEEIEAEYV